MIAQGWKWREGRESPSPTTEFVDVTRANGTAPYVVSVWCGRFVRWRVLLAHKAGGLRDGCARKLLACRASRSFIRPLASLGPAADAGIASTHPLTAVAPACGTGTGLGTLPVQFGGHLAAALSVALDPVLVKHPAGFNCIVGQELTTPCGTLYLRRSGWQSDKATAKAYVGEELSV